MNNESDLAAEVPATPPVKNPLLGPANVLAAFGTVWIFVLMMLVVADVLGRNFFDAPITGVAEFAARSVASIVFLQLAAAICTGRMTRSDFLLRLIGRRSPSAVKAIEVLYVVVGALLFAGVGRHRLAGVHRRPAGRRIFWRAGCLHRARPGPSACSSSSVPCWPPWPTWPAFRR